MSFTQQTKAIAFKLIVCEEDSIATIKSKYDDLIQDPSDDYAWRKKCCLTVSAIQGHYFLLFLWTFSNSIEQYVVFTQCTDGEVEMGKTLTENGMHSSENEKYDCCSLLWIFYKPKQIYEDFLSLNECSCHKFLWIKYLWILFNKMWWKMRKKMLTVFSSYCDYHSSILTLTAHLSRCKQLKIMV